MRVAMPADHEVAAAVGFIAQSRAEGQVPPRVSRQEPYDVKGMLVGGAFGAALTRSSKSSGRRDRNAALGAVLGGAAAASKTRPGRVYTVTTNEGTAIQIATEQTEIRVDDCVFVEESGGTANIRRAPATACDPASQDVMKDAAIIEEMQEEASECAAAKQELVDADSDDAIDRAVRKVKLLCYD